MELGSDFLWGVRSGEADLSNQIQDYITSLRVSDEPGLFSDSFEMRFANPQGKLLELPEIGQVLEISIGRDEKLVMGSYAVDEIALEGPTSTMLVRGQSADFAPSLKSQKNHKWNKVELPVILESIAARNGLRAKIASEFNGIQVDQLDQNFESDMNILTRLADDYGAVAKPANGFLIFSKRGSGKSVEGRPLPAVSLKKEDVLGWRYERQNREIFKRVGAYYHPHKSKKSEFVYVGEGVPMCYCRHPFKDASAARSAATAKMDAINRAQEKLSVQMIGSAFVVAEAPIAISDFHSEIDGKWIVTRADHTISSSGYTTSAELCRPT